MGSGRYSEYSALHNCQPLYQTHYLNLSYDYSVNNTAASNLRVMTKLCIEITHIEVLLEDAYHIEGIKRHAWIEMRDLSICVLFVLMYI